jgi:hypothetical protein
MMPTSQRHEMRCPTNSVTLLKCTTFKSGLRMWLGATFCMISFCQCRKSFYRATVEDDVLTIYFSFFNSRSTLQFMFGEILFNEFDKNFWF